jgi:hypothetical protein
MFFPVGGRRVAEHPNHNATAASAADTNPSPSVPSKNSLTDVDRYALSATPAKLQCMAFYSPQLPLDSAPASPSSEVKLAMAYGITGFVIEYAYTGSEQDSAKVVSEVAACSNGSFSFCLSFRVDQDNNLSERIQAVLDVARRYFDLPSYERYLGRPVVVIETQLPAGAFSKAVPDSEPEGRPFLIYGALSELTDSPVEAGFDAAIQLAPHTVSNTHFPPSKVWVGQGWSDTDKKVYSYASVKRATLNRPKKSYPEFEAVYAGWDSETEAYGYPTVLLYRQWLNTIGRRAFVNPSLPTPLVFVKSWNDWKHNCAVAPDKRYGYKDLEATKAVLLDTDQFVQYDPTPFTTQQARVELLAYFSPQERATAAPAASQPCLEGWSTKPELLRREIEIAQHYGVTGFIVEYGYQGDRGRSKDLIEAFAKVCPENFTFGISILIPSELALAQDFATLLDEVAPYRKHPQYLRYANRPVVLIESPLEPKAFETPIRNRRNQEPSGDGSPFLVLASLSDLTQNPIDFGFDSTAQLSPHCVKATSHLPRQTWLDYGATDSHKGIYSYGSLKRAMLNRSPKEYAEIAALYVGWNSESVAYGYPTHLVYQQWLWSCCKRAANKKRLPVPIVLLKSWNDWDRHCAIAPDRRYGFKSLESTRNALAGICPEGDPKPPAIDLSQYSFQSDMFEGVPKKPVVILQMGSVGSKALTSALASSEFSDKVVHTHCLDRFDERIELAIRELPDPAFALREFMKGKVIREWMDRANDDTVWNLVTLVRDPISRNLSSFINALDAYMPDAATRIESGELSLEELQYMFLTIGYSVKLCDWYKEFFEPVFPFEIGALPYENGKGYVIAEKLPYRLIVLRNEDLAQSLTPALHEFLGIDRIRMESINRTEEKKYGDLYRQFRKLAWPEAYIDDMYDDPVVRAYYSEEEIARSRKLYLEGVRS